MFNALKTSVPTLALVNVPAMTRPAAILALASFGLAVRALASGTAEVNPFRITPNWHASEVAPATYPELCKCFESQQVLTVWSGGSDSTIYGLPSTNHAFRAWHDFRHITECADWSHEGELAAFRAQACDLREYCTKIRTGSYFYTRMLSVLQAEVVGMLMYQAKHDGAFPKDQREFVLAFLQYGPETVTGIDY